MAAATLKGYKTSIPTRQMLQDAPGDQPYDRVVPTEWKLALQKKLGDPTSTWKSVAKDIGFTQQTVYLWTRNPEFQRYENWLITKQFKDLPPAVQEAKLAAKDRIERTFESHAEEMQARLLVILETCEDVKVQTQICQDWLDRTPGGIAAKTSDKRSLQLVMTPELLQIMAERSREAGFVPSPAAIDAEKVG